MYSRSSLGKNIWDDGHIHIPPGYKGNAFRPQTKEEIQFQDRGKIHPPEQKLYTGGNKQYISNTIPHRWQQRTFENDIPVDYEMYKEENIDTEDIGKSAEEDDENEDIIPEQGILPQHREQSRILSQTSPENTQLHTLLTGLLQSLGKEEWLLIIVLILLLADGSDAWDIILLLILLLGVH